MALGKASTIERLITAVAHNDMANAKRAVLRICEENTVEKYRAWCKNIKATIERQPSLVNLSARAEMMAYRVDALLFDEELFFVSEREQALLERIQTMERTGAQLQAAGINYRNAALMYGPTGCGKTAFAKLIAKRLGRELYVVNLAAVIDSYLGGTAKNLSAVFKAVSDAGANCVLFLDELDAISNNRDGRELHGGPDKELSRATMAMMQELDMLPPEVVLLAATNHMESLDAAVLRRFPVQHEFLTFTQCERESMVRQYLRTIQNRGAFPITWAEPDLASFAAATEGLGQAVVIEMVTKSISDMVAAGTEHLVFSCAPKG